MSEIEYVELKVKCAECGKEMRLVTVEGTDTSDYLCPQCSAGEFNIDTEE